MVGDGGGVSSAASQRQLARQHSRLGGLLTDNSLAATACHANPLQLTATNCRRAAYSSLSLQMSVLLAQQQRRRARKQRLTGAGCS
jgi:hypothetical protein